MQIFPSEHWQISPEGYHQVHLSLLGLPFLFYATFLLYNPIYPFPHLSPSSHCDNSSHSPYYQKGSPRLYSALEVAAFETKVLSPWQGPGREHHQCVILPAPSWTESLESKDLFPSLAISHAMAHSAIHPTTGPAQPSSVFIRKY